MEVILHPNVIREIERGQLHRNWRAMKARIEAAEGAWQLVQVTEGSGAGIVAAVREKLEAVGFKGHVVALKGMMIHQRPWSGWAVYARVPHSITAPSGKVY